MRLAQSIFFFCNLISMIAFAEPSRANLYTHIKQCESLEIACTCDCHQKTYSIKQCTICAHFGGKFMPPAEKSLIIPDAEISEE
jgi:hypothetical protein